MDESLPEQNPDDSRLNRQPRTEGQSIADEIALHTRILLRLQEKQKAYNKFLEQHATLLAPIRRLPLEVLQSIFLLCLPKDHNPSLSPKEAPFLLCHVCARWRDVVLRTPLLWARLHVHVPIYPEVPISYKGLRSSRDSGRHLEPDNLAPEERDLYTDTVLRWDRRMVQYSESITSWLTRAAKCPLDISLQQSPNVSDPSKGKAAQDHIVQIICSFSSQWKHLQIHAPVPVVAGIISTPKDRVPLLERLAVQWDISYRERFEGNGAGASEAEPAIPEVRIFRAHNLSQLSLQNVPYPLKHFSMRWNRLTELILGKFAEPNRDHFAPRPVLFPNRALDILERCPNIVRCRMTLGKTYTRNSPASGSVCPEGETRAKIHLPYLECLSINEGNPLLDFFTFLEVPALKELIYKTAQYPRSDRHTALLPLFQNYGYNIKKVILDDSMLSVGDLEECFRLLPNVTDLKLTRMSYIRSPYDRSSPEESNFVVGYLSHRIWKKLTPRIASLDADVGGSSSAGGSSPNIVGTLEDDELLLPNLVSFSCRVHAPELVQDKVIRFLRARRHPSLLPSPSLSSSWITTPPSSHNTPTTTTASPHRLQKFSIMFYSTEPEHTYKNITTELERLGTDVDGMTLEVKHRRTYGDSLLGSNDFIVKPLLQPKWPTTGDRPGTFFGVDDVYEEDE